MATFIPSQYKGFQNPPVNEISGLSPLQLALLYYVQQGQQSPFFVNRDWLQALKTFADSGVVDPKVIGGTGPIITRGDDVYTIEPKPDCGPDDTDRYDLLYRGKSSNLFPTDQYWQCSTDQLIRGGSAADGAGGPWATGGIDGPASNPVNGVDRPDPVVANVNLAYSLPADTTNSALYGLMQQQAATTLSGYADDKTQNEIQSNLFGNAMPTYVQGIT